MDARTRGREGLYRIRLRDSGMDVRKCVQPAPDVIRRMEAQYVHTSIHPNFHPRTELAEFV